MPNYKCEGVDKENKKIKEVFFAYSPKALYEQKSREGIFLYDITEVVDQKDPLQIKFKSKKLCEFSRQIGTMQGAGIPIIKALDIMVEREKNVKVKRVYEFLLQYVNQGYTLSQGMENCKSVFPKLIINMFKAGEISGKLDEAAKKMADYYEGENKINTKIKNAMAYPCLLMALTFGIVIILFTYVLPIFLELYESSGTELNILTKILLLFSTFVTTHYFWIIIGLFGFILFMTWLCSQYQVALKIDRWKVRVPKFGPLLQVIYTARFARTMSSLYSSGIVMIDAVETASKTINNRYIELQFKDVVKKISDGTTLSVALEGVDGIESKLISSIYVGEESGQLDTMLNSVALEYEFEADAAIARMLTIVEPLMIIIMALIIGPILIAVMIPMFDMYSMIGK